ncbi:MAG: endonuclease III [Bacillota bacterium]
MKKNKLTAKRKKILEKLSELYPDASTELEYSDNFELLIAVMLSAQCTDKQVNKITSGLFKKYKSPEDIAKLSWEDLAEEIKGCGLYRNKSKNIVNTSRILVDKYNSVVPENREDLESLPGVGRKTANVVMSVAFGCPVMPVDTHVFRVSRRLGLSAGKNPVEVENDLQMSIPTELMGAMHHCLILHGRRLCRARNPHCGECGLSELCTGKEGDSKQ